MEKLAADVQVFRRLRNGEARDDPLLELENDPTQFLAQLKKGRGHLDYADLDKEREVLRSFATNALLRKQSSIAFQRKKLPQQKSAVGSPADSTSSQAALQREVDHLRAYIGRMQEMDPNDARDREVQIEKLIEKSSVLEQENLHRLQERKEMVSHAQELMTMLTEEKANAEEQSALVAELTAAVEALENENAELRNSNAAVAAGLNDAKKAHDILEFHTLELGEQKSGLLEGVRERQAQLDYSTAQIQFSSEKLVRAEKLKELAEKEAQSKDAKLKEVNQNNATLKTEKTDLTKKLKESEAQNAKLTKQNKDQTSKTQAMEGTIQKAREDTAQLLDDFGGYIASIRDVTQRISQALPEADGFTQIAHALDDYSALLSATPSAAMSPSSAPHSAPANAPASAAASASASAAGSPPAGVAAASPSNSPLAQEQVDAAVASANAKHLSETEKLDKQISELVSQLKDATSKQDDFIKAVRSATAEASKEIQGARAEVLRLSAEDEAALQDVRKDNNSLRVETDRLQAAALTNRGKVVVLEMELRKAQGDYESLLKKARVHFSRLEAYDGYAGQMIRARGRVDDAEPSREAAALAEGIKAKTFAKGLVGKTLKPKIVTLKVDAKSLHVHAGSSDKPSDTFELVAIDHVHYGTSWKNVPVAEVPKSFHSVTIAVNGMLEHFEVRNERDLQALVLTLGHSAVNAAGAIRSRQTFSAVKGKLKLQDYCERRGIGVEAALLEGLHRAAASGVVLDVNKITSTAAPKTATKAVGKKASGGHKGGTTAKAAEKKASVVKKESTEKVAAKGASVERPRAVKEKGAVKAKGASVERADVKAKGASVERTDVKAKDSVKAKEVVAKPAKEKAVVKAKDDKPKKSVSKGDGQPKQSMMSKLEDPDKPESSVTSSRASSRSSVRLRKKSDASPDKSTTVAKSSLDRKSGDEKGGSTSNASAASSDKHKKAVVKKSTSKTSTKQPSSSKAATSSAKEKSAAAPASDKSKVVKKSSVDSTKAPVAKKSSSDTKAKLVSKKGSSKTKASSKK